MGPCGNATDEALPRFPLLALGIWGTRLNSLSSPASWWSGEETAGQTGRGGGWAGAGEGDGYRMRTKEREWGVGPSCLEEERHRWTSMGSERGRLPLPTPAERPVSPGPGQPAGPRGTAPCPRRVFSGPCPHGSSASSSDGPSAPREVEAAWVERGGGGPGSGQAHCSEKEELTSAPGAVPPTPPGFLPPAAGVDFAHLIWGLGSHAERVGPQTQGGVPCSHSTTRGTTF